MYISLALMFLYCRYSTTAHYYIYKYYIAESLKFCFCFVICEMVKWIKEFWAELGTLLSIAKICPPTNSVLLMIY
jgi:hypothetical protein